MTAVDTARAALVEQLRDIVGARYVLERDAELLAYESDGLPGYHRRPRVAVFPASRDEVIAVVRALADAEVPFVPRGAGTGLSGGALADDAVLLGLHRLKSVLAVDAANLRATVEPGVVNAALNRALAQHGVFYAPDPSSEAACTIGGNVAENAGGPHCLKYGVTLNHIVAATVLLPNGDIVTLGDADGAMRGHDLLGAFVGSEGCFGVALDVTVRLVRRPESVKTALADFPSVDAAARATSAIIASGVLPAALEFMDAEVIRVVEQSIYAAGYPADAAAILLVEVDGTAESTAEDIETVRRLCEEAGARAVRVARDDAERMRLWQGRKKAFGAMGRMAPHLAVQDAVIPRTRLPDVLARIRAIADQHGVLVSNVFHAGDGNLHPNIAYDANDAEQAERVHETMSEIMRACIDAGGSITGEHGVGLDKIGYMDLLFDAPTLTAMCDVRAVFDPERRANPGKVVPAHACREWHGAGRARGFAPRGTGSGAGAPSRGVGGLTPARGVASEGGQEPAPTAALPGRGDYERLETAAVSASAVPSPRERSEHAPGARSATTPHERASARTSREGASAPDHAIATRIRDAITSSTPLRIVGRGTWLDAGHPVAATETLSLAHDTGIVAYSPGDLTVTMRAGTTLGELQQALREHDQWVALDPEGGDDITLGAIVATCSYGPSAPLFGTPRDQVLGMTVVLGTGEIIRVGGRVVKNVAGFDLTRLMTGAWGSLGVITELTLRVRSRGSTKGSLTHMRRVYPAKFGYREPVVVVPALSRALKQTLDPHHILNPGILGELQ